METIFTTNLLLIFLLVFLIIACYLLIAIFKIIKVSGEFNINAFDSLIFMLSDDKEMKEALVEAAWKRAKENHANKKLAEMLNKS